MNSLSIQMPLNISTRCQIVVFLNKNYIEEALNEMVLNILENKHMYKKSYQGYTKMDIIMIALQLLGRNDRLSRNSFVSKADNWLCWLIKIRMLVELAKLQKQDKRFFSLKVIHPTMNKYVSESRLAPITKPFFFFFGVRFRNTCIKTFMTSLISGITAQGVCSFRSTHCSFSYWHCRKTGIRLGK